MKNKINLFTIIFITIFMFACQSTVIYTNQDTSKTKQKTREKTRIPKQTRPSQYESKTEVRPQRGDNGKIEYMVASWYGNPFHGRQTANGETYNMYDYTAAHRTLPFGTRLKLINEANNKEAIVRINDRGPVPLERDIDVSYKTAADLDFVDIGLARLRVIYLD